MSNKCIKFVPALWASTGRPPLMQALATSNLSTGEVMNRATVLIIIFLALLAAVGSWAIVYCDALELRSSEVVSSLIAVIATLGALISATFVVASYLQTNKAYVESQRPHLLTFVENKKYEESGEPLSIIHYHNITNNRFNDLTISVKVESGNRIYDLSYFFRKNMAMIGQDRRQRSFKPAEELIKAGLNLQETSSSGKEVKLIVGYGYTFNGVVDNVNAQQYRWDAIDQLWEIC
jgi:hypothetical protein